MVPGGQYDQGGNFGDFADAADNVAGQTAQTILEVTLDDQRDSKNSGQGD